MSGEAGNSGIFRIDLDVDSLDDGRSGFEFDLDLADIKNETPANVMQFPPGGRPGPGRSTPADIRLPATVVSLLSEAQISDAQEEWDIDLDLDSDSKDDKSSDVVPFPSGGRPSLDRTQPAQMRSYAPIVQLPSPEQYRDEDKMLRQLIYEVVNSGAQQSFYLLNEGALVRNLRIFQRHFLANDTRRRIFYAVKANPDVKILEILKKYGVDGFDCASSGEIELGLTVGMTPHQLGLHHPVPSLQDVIYGLQQGVLDFTAQQRNGINRILEAVRTARLQDKVSDKSISIRVATMNPNAEIKLDEKFGCKPEEAVEHLKRIRAIGFRSGITVHTGSQNTDPSSYSRAVEMVAHIAEQAGGVDRINFGGGFPVNYKRGEPNRLPYYLRTLTDAIYKFEHKMFSRDANPEILIEPGRAQVGSAVDLVIPVREVRNGNEIYIGDGVFTSFSDYPIHGWEYEIQPVMRENRSAGPIREYRVWGQTCDSGDRLHNLWLPANIDSGDFLWVTKAGAYMKSQATEFNGFKPPICISYNEVDN